MEKLICDQCGTHNDATEKVCHLCGDPLDEEREEERKRQTPLLIAQAVALTLVVVGVPGYFFEMFVALKFAGSSYRPLTFWFVYLVLWAIILMLADKVGPDDGYVRANVSTRRSHLSRHQEQIFWYALIFVPAVLVREYWVEVFRALRR